MSNKGISDGAAFGVIVVIILIIAAVKKLIEAVPVELWIALGIMVGVGFLALVTSWFVSAYRESQAAAEERARAERAAQEAAAKRERELKAQKEKKRRIETLGTDNAALVESALAAAKQVGASEAARTGWLGDVDFTVDIRAITDKFQKAHALRRVADKLSALDKPSLDDRKILAEANTTIAGLEVAAVRQVELIVKCATEARLIDKSIREERKDARTAEQRAELHAKLSGMLYGIEATPDASPPESAADSVMARVQAYREIRNQIQLARDS